VKTRLVLGVVDLAMKTHQIIKGKHNKKTGAFVRACLAYAYITIPSMEDLFGRLQLYLFASTTALINHALPMADSFLKSAITLVQEVPAVLESDGQVKSSEDQLVSFLNQFVSVLVVVPGHPEHGAFYLTKGLLKVVKEYPWEKGSTGKSRVLLSILSLYCTYYQNSLPYHIDKVESNDVLYGGDNDFTDELLGSIDKLLEEILEDISKLKDDPDITVQKKQARLALDLFNMIIGYAVLNAKLASVAVTLYSLAKKFTSDIAYLKNALCGLEIVDAKLAQEMLTKLKSL